MGLGLVYPPMATLEYPAPASRSDQGPYVSETGLSNRLVEEDPGLIAHLLWSGKHGLISLKIAGRLMTEVSPPIEEMLSEMGERILRSFLKIEQN